MFAIALSLLMGLAGIAKLLGAQPIVEQFDEFGLPPVAMYAVGATEVAIAVGLHTSAVLYAALLGIPMMLGAIGFHVKVSHPPSQSAPAVLVLLLSAFVAWSSF